MQQMEFIVEVRTVVRFLVEVLVVSVVVVFEVTITESDQQFRL